MPRGRPKKKSAKELAKEINYDLVELIHKKVEKFKKGDFTAAPTTDEAKFLQDVIKLEQEAEQGEAVVAYLNDMSDDELDKYHEMMKKSLEGEGLN